jgi:L-ribulose-5-phosphate 3-epimerase
MVERRTRSLLENPLGIYEKALPPGTWERSCELAASLGFSFIELSIDESDERMARLDWGQAECDALVAVARRHGLRVPSVCLSANRKAPLGSPDPAIAAESLSIVRRAVDVADMTGLRIVQIAGYDTYYEEWDPAAPQRFVENMRTAVDYAASRGVMLSVEIMDTRFMSSVSRFLHLRQQIPSPWLTVYPDLGNLSAWNDNPAQELELALRGGLVAAVHLKDTRPPDGQRPGQFRDVPFGEGCVDFAGLFGVLARHGYAGPFLLEMWNHGDEDTRRISDAREWIRHQMHLGETSRISW